MPEPARDSVADFAETPFVVDCAPLFLTARFLTPQRTLGWSLLHPGFATIRDIVWVEVRDKDLGPNVDPRAFLRARLAQARLPQALAFMTSRDIRRHHFRKRHVENVEACCLTTVGLSNGERVGARRVLQPHVGTINTLVHVSAPLTEGAMIEALSIAAQARTAAVLETRPSGATGPITGTGTDCIVVSAPCQGDMLDCAGLHTAVGEAIGGAVYDATREGAETWDADAEVLGGRHSF
ncbi:MAG: adenosylcobinamide amidohydrolase [Rhodoblastus sp.]|uniref:adenosylcobinamide amidohydrolase n=1 Tax=Rhodoblastus sp. TaxID=1962975 RepID=UPI003F9B49F0